MEILFMGLFMGPSYLAVILLTRKYYVRKIKRLERSLRVDRRQRMYRKEEKETADAVDTFLQDIQRQNKNGW